jgi:dTMP kinase
MRWIVVDGIDGSGKSTFASWIAEHYSSKGEKVLIRIHPSGTWAGRRSRRALEGEGKVMSLLATAFFILDVLGSLGRLRRDRREYDTVVFVRYLMATAYLPERLAPWGYDFFAKLLPVPGRLLLVDVDAETANRRIHERQHTREMFDDVESLTKVRGKVLGLAARGGWRVIDNTLPEGEARSSLLSTLQEWDAAS